MTEEIRFDGQGSTVVLAVSDQGTQIVYWGAKLDATEEALLLLGSRNPAPGAASTECPITLCPTLAAGYIGHAGVELQTEDGGWDANPIGFKVEESSPTHAVIVGEDKHTGVVLRAELEWCDQTDILKIRHSLRNSSSSSCTINWLAAGTVPIACHMDHLTDFEGRWALEFQTVSGKLRAGAHVRENLRGRTSHDCFPGAILREGSTSEQVGDAIGLHFGWSGNHKSVTEILNDGRTAFQVGERLLPGEARLAVGETWQTPWVFGSFSDAGFNGLSQNFHRYVRTHLLDANHRKKTRPVHYNTWEAIYFDHSERKLNQLVDKAASLGVERFVLDDGWFRGRRNDATGLGDWFVDTSVYPQGLAPLIERVNAYGMEFGLWVEPEMVNPDSDLYRKHPDWVLKAQTTAQIPSRNQLVLDLSRAEVWQYLFARLDALLIDNNIAYLKWDMNRDIQHPGSGGVPSVHRQVQALYRLINAVRDKYPDVEIESCSSGGARADFGVLSYTDRVWTSDSNDALDRLDIQRGASLFLPTDVLGAHVGPRDCHITGRTLSMELRAATAMFGHMGLEMDLGELTLEESETLKAAIALHKRFRPLIHSGDYYRLDGPPHARSFGVVSEDKREALFSYSQVATRRTASPEKWRFAGVDPDREYHFNVVWSAGRERIKLDQLSGLNGQRFKGELLVKAGLQLPEMLPESALVVHLEA